MRVLLHDETDLELTDVMTPGFEVESSGEEVPFSALQMFATSLALCTLSVLVSWAQHAGTDPSSISIGIRWAYAPKPMRVSEIEMAIRWPDLPPERLEAARRAAEQCTLHHTLAQPPPVVTRVLR